MDPTVASGTLSSTGPSHICNVAGGSSFCCLSAKSAEESPFEPASNSTGESLSGVSSKRSCEVGVAHGVRSIIKPRSGPALVWMSASLEMFSTCVGREAAQ